MTDDSPRRSTFATLILVLLAVLTLLLGAIAWRQRSLEARLASIERALAAGSGFGHQTPTIAVEAGDGPTKGSADAPVSIVEFSDFTCHACAQLQPELDQALAARPGKVRLTFRYFPLAPSGKPFDLARAAECARRQDRFWPAHDLLFLEAHDIESLPRAIERFASIGIDRAALTACLADDASAARVRAEASAGQSYGVNATPTLFIDGRKYEGALPANDLETAIDTALAARAEKR